MKQQRLKNLDRIQLLDELQRRYKETTTLGQKFIYYRKRYAWIFVILFARFFKRTVDIFGSITLLILLFPIMLAIALIIKLTDGGSVFYISTRVGKWGHEFQFPKFRTMIPRADEIKYQYKDLDIHKDQGITFKIVDDPRVTGIGKILRKTSLDELPQLWTVLKGDMSLVGPRPPLPEEVAKYNLAQRRRLDIKPGITCIWQVSGRSELPFEKQVKLDLEYIESQSLWLDIKLLLKTVPAVIFGRGAY